MLLPDFRARCLCGVLEFKAPAGVQGLDPDGSYRAGGGGCEWVSEGVAARDSWGQ